MAWSPLDSRPATLRDQLLPSVPVILEPVDHSFVKTPRPVIQGTADPHSTVVVYEGTTALCAATATAAGAWSCTPANELGHGIHTISATASDSAGNTSEHSTGSTFTVDLEIPEPPRFLHPSQNSWVNTDKPIFRGTAEPHSTVQLVVNGTQNITLAVDATGHWGGPLTMPLTEGDHTASATATDRAGHTSPSSETLHFTVDTVPPLPPTVSAPTPGSKVNTRKPTFAGHAEPGSIVRIFVNREQQGTAPAVSGAWRLEQPDHELSEDTHEVTVDSIDPAGNFSQLSSAVSFEVDTTPPPAPVVMRPSNGELLTVARPTFQGTTDTGTSVTLVLDGRELGDVSIDATGRWQHTPDFDLTEGGHRLSAVASDEAGNTASSAEVSFSIDSIRPVSPVVEVPAIVSATPTFRGTAEAHSLVTVYVDGTSLGSTTSSAQMQWELTQPAPLTSGTHIVMATATDAAGNTSSLSPPVSFTVDAEAPAAPVVTAVPNGAFIRDTRPILSGIAEPESRVTVQLNGSDLSPTHVDATGQWSIQVPTVLAQGEHRFSAKAQDMAGNISAASPLAVFTVDTLPPPAPVVTSPYSGAAVSSRTPALTGQAEPFSRVTLSLDGASIGPITVDAEGNWSHTPPLLLSEGTHSLTATATDRAGNEGPASAPTVFTVDTVQPQAPVLASLKENDFTNDSTPRLAGTAEAGSSIQVVVDGNLVRTASVDATGAWSLDIDTTLAEGPHTLTFSVTDASGNTVSSTLTFTVDTTAPETLLSEGSPQLQASSATFEFSSEGGSTFECSLDEADFASCASPITFEALGAGHHNFRVRAEDRAGNVDPSPATSNWTQPPADGGQGSEADEGGCSTSGGNTSALLVWLTLAILAARRWSGKSASPTPGRTAAPRSARWP